MTGMSFCSPDHSNCTARHNDAFVVDDTTGGVNDTHLSTPLSPTELTARLQKQAQLWQRLLFASGGRLELPKYFYYLIVKVDQRRRHHDVHCRTQRLNFSHLGL
jgi:hypothetical protein